MLYDLYKIQNLRVMREYFNGMSYGDAQR